MNRILNSIMAAAVAILLWSPAASALPDQFTGDNAIYTGSEVDIQPNVLIIFDTSGSMSDTVSGGNYVYSTTYSSAGNYCGGAACLKSTVYECTHFGADGCDTWVSIGPVGTMNFTCEGSNAKTILAGQSGQWIGVSHKLVAGSPTGGCSAASGGTFEIGNHINWSHVLGPPRSKIAIAQDVIIDLINATQGVSFGLMRFNSSTSEGGSFISKTVSAKVYTSIVKNMLPIHNGTTTNRQALINIIGTQLTANGYTPLAETLYEAYRYFSGQTPYFGGGITGTTDATGKYISPIVAGCQKNYIIIITDGMSTQDRNSKLATICTTAQGYPKNGDCDRDGFEPYNDPAKDYSSSGSDYLNDVARFLHDSDMAPGFAGTQNVITYTIGFGLGTSNAGAVKLLDETAKQGDLDNTDAHAYLAENAGDLSEALTQIFGTIAQVNSSFVAPVVPVSPENKVYSGSRVYLGFFKPIARHPWYGNLKKYGFDDKTNLIDKNGAYANFVDLDNDMRDDRDNFDLSAQVGAQNGSFRETSKSYWSITPDGGTVESGGVGGMLLTRNFATKPRLIYTYQTGNTTDLTAAVNRFDITQITPTILSVGTTTERDNIVNFMYGYDVYDQNGNKLTTDKRAWILGDVLHSKPLIVNYAAYTQTPTTEPDCNVNKTMIYVGANDGMLHAFKDCDGSEAWAFIPPNALPNLQYFDDVTHTYYIDSSPVAYIFDANQNQNIDTGDKVILAVGQRRGGGSMGLPATGWYYALDVTNPSRPVLLWTLSSSTTGFAEMGETFSEPKIVKTRMGTTDNRMVMFIGGGYDNCNEDGRFGNTQKFPGTCNTTLAAGDEGVQTSAGAALPITPRGRGIFAIEIARLSGAGVPSFATSGSLLWSITPADMTFSIASEMAAVDTNYDGYVDLLYAGDTGGNLWRINVRDMSTTNWTAQKIFSANPGSSNGAGDGSNGRKIFYKPSVALETGAQMVYFGTGDREHPLNRSVTDRMYAFFDRGQSGTKTEADLVDVTVNKLQAGTAAEVTSTLNSLHDPNKFGWYVRLNQKFNADGTVTEVADNGEKVLALPLVMNKYVYFTTYSPDTVVSSDPCVGGNLGTGRVYVMDYLTGEAVINFDKTNDSQFSSYKANGRATPADGMVLLRSDRVKTIGSGIPSGVVPVTSKTGDTTILVGTGGSITQLLSGDLAGGKILWRQK